MTLTLIECGTCGGHLYPARNVNTGEAIFAMCSDCGHDLAESDLTPNLDDGESLTWDHEGRLAYRTAEYWGACGVPECDDCLPRFDADNGPIESA